MLYWLYQMHAYNEDEEGYQWRPEDYISTVRDGRLVEWKRPKPILIEYRGCAGPSPGDKVVFFFCKSSLRKEEKPGIYGIGEITQFDNSFRTGRFLQFMRDRTPGTGRAGRRGRQRRSRAASRRRAASSCFRSALSRRSSTRYWRTASGWLCFHTSGSKRS